MSDIRAMFKESLRPSQIFRELQKQGKFTTLSELNLLIIAEYPEINPLVLNTVIKWNRGTNPEAIRRGLNDDRLDEVLLGLYIDEFSK